MPKFTEVHAKSLDMVVRAFARAHFPPIEGQEVFQLSAATSLLTKMAKEIREEISKENAVKAGLPVVPEPPKKKKKVSKKKVANLPDEVQKAMNDGKVVREVKPESGN